MLDGYGLLSWVPKTPPYPDHVSHDHTVRRGHRPWDEKPFKNKVKKNRKHNKAARKSRKRNRK